MRSPLLSPCLKSAAGIGKSGARTRLHSLDRRGEIEGGNASADEVGDELLCFDDLFCRGGESSCDCFIALGGFLTEELMYRPGDEVRLRFRCC